MKYFGGGGGSGGGAVSSVFGRIGAIVAQLGDYGSSLITNQSGVSGATVTAALNTLASVISGLVTGVSSVFGRSGAVTAQNGDYTAQQINVSAGARILGRWANSAGLIEEATLGGGLEVNPGLTGPQVATTGPARTSENVTVDFWPTVIDKGVIGIGAVRTAQYAIPAGKTVDVTCRCQVKDTTTQAIVFFSRLLVSVQNVGGVLTVILATDCGTVASAGWSLVAANVGTDLVFSLTNASGISRSSQMIVSGIVQDL